MRDAGAAAGGIIAIPVRFGGSTCRALLRVQLLRVRLLACLDLCSYLRVEYPLRAQRLVAVLEDQLRELARLERVGRAVRAAVALESVVTAMGAGKNRREEREATHTTADDQPSASQASLVGLFSDRSRSLFWLACVLVCV